MLTKRLRVFRILPRGTGRLPRVLVDTLDVTVGGTLSAGGLGNTSHRYGMQIGQVEQLDVVTGTGDRVWCSRTRNADLFDAVRGGQGQFGVITDAWIRVRKAGERIRQYELRYRDPDRFARDFEQAVDTGRFGRLRAETRFHDSEIIMDAGVEYDREHDDGTVLEGLRYEEIVGIREAGVPGGRHAIRRKPGAPGKGEVEVESSMDAAQTSRKVRLPYGPSRRAGRHGPR